MVSEILDSVRRSRDFLNLACLTKGDEKASQIAYRLLILESWHALVRSDCLASNVPVPDLKALSLKDARTTLPQLDADLITVVFNQLAETYALGDFTISKEDRKTSNRNLQSVVKGLRHQQEVRLGKIEQTHQPIFYTTKKLGRMTPALFVLLVLSGFIFQAFVKPMFPIDISELSEKKQSGYPWDGPGVMVLDQEKKVDLKTLSFPKHIELSFDWNDEYEIKFFKDGKEVARELFRAQQGHGLTVKQATLPEIVTKIGIDSLAIRGRGGDGKYSIGHIILR
jgi:hypothetical protein